MVYAGADPREPHPTPHMSRLREILYPFEIALQRSPEERPEFRRAVRTADLARLALEQEYAQLRQLGISGELLLIDHDHRHVIVERRPLPNSSPSSSVVRETFGSTAPRA